MKYEASGISHYCEIRKYEIRKYIFTLMLIVCFICFYLYIG